VLPFVDDPLFEKVRRRLGDSSDVAPIELPAVRRLIDERRFPEAVGAARAACEASGADPAHAYWIGFATALVGRPVQAKPWLEIALGSNPLDVRAHAALALVSKHLGDKAAQVAHYRKAVELQPRNPMLRAGCAEALLENGQPEDGEREARTGLAISPGHSVCVAALARTIQAQGRGAEAIRLLEESLKSKDDRDLAWILADVYLRAGNYLAGFKAFEIRRRPSLHREQVRDPVLSKPEWHGDALAGRQLLVVHEQGLGDTLQAMGYAWTLAARGQRISAVVPKAMLRFFGAQDFLQHVYGDGEAIPRRAYDCWCFTMSLPLLLGEDGSGPMPRKAYLAAFNDDTMRLHASPSALKVGLCWAGSTDNPEEPLRSISLHRFAPLAEVPRLQLTSCQYGVEPSALPGFIRPPPRAIVDLADTSALISQFDVLISVDTAAAHLAGAMGREVWLLARWFGDWRWGTSGDTTYWYPTMRIIVEEIGSSMYPFTLTNLDTAGPDVVGASRR